ncbi:MAG: C40 family peptidase [Cellvibrionaceae bacterium]|nr:C40 family peptidase [Cellvibrionaceae bacterium]
MSQQLPWYCAYLGKPWRAYATGPAAYDCWGLVVAVLRDQFLLHDVPRCLHVPSGDCQTMHNQIYKELETGCWFSVDSLKEGAVVLMAKSHIVRHIGIVTGGSLLHCRRGSGVCIEPLSFIQQCLGFRHCQYFLHKELL